MPRHLDRRVSAAMEDAAEEALETLLAADRLLEIAKPAGMAGLMLLLAPKAGPTFPHELAAVLRSPSPRVRQRLLRLRTRQATSAFVEALPDGRYRLSRKGHRFVNAIAALGLHATRAASPSRR